MKLVVTNFPCKRSTGVGVGSGRDPSTSTNWKGRAAEWTTMDWMRIYKHNNNRDIIMKMSPHASINCFQVWVPHFSFLSCFLKCSFDKPPGNSLDLQQGKGQWNSLFWNNNFSLVILGLKAFIYDYDSS